jgi:hypothetical protein
MAIFCLAIILLIASQNVLVYAGGGATTRIDGANWSGFGFSQLGGYYRFHPSNSYNSCSSYPCSSNVRYVNGIYLEGSIGIDDGYIIYGLEIPDDVRGYLSSLTIRAYTYNGNECRIGFWKKDFGTCPSAPSSSGWQWFSGFTSTVSRANFIPHPGASFIPHFFCGKF